MKNRPPMSAPSKSLDKIFQMAKKKSFKKFVEKKIVPKIVREDRIETSHNFDDSDPDMRGPI